jgi:hypothetical protein
MSLPFGCGSTVAGGGGSAGSGGGSVGSGGSGGSAQVFDDCSGPGQCVLAGNTCCGVCGAPAVTDMAAVNNTLFDEYRTYICPMPTGCPECATQLNPNLFAYCEASKCIAADVTMHAFSECTTAADCSLRHGMECCESCAGDAYDLVALNANGKTEIYQTVCDPLASCPDCAPNYPPEYKADCMAGRCVVVGP